MTAAMLGAVLGDRPVNVLVVGVGGQGVIMVSKVLAQLGQDQGFMVKQSEVHGMAKRGGSVFSHVRFGRQVWSPTIPRGEADVLLAMEWAEGLRWLPHLRPDTGVFIADTRKIMPPFAFRDRRHGAADAYVKTTPPELLGRVSHGYALDATRIAEALGNPRIANTVLLGALSTAFAFPAEHWLSVIGQFVPAKTVAVNYEAFQRGRAWIEAGAAPGEPARPPAPATAAAAGSTVSWQINPAWCKGCDICVKFCPERCLAMAGGKAVLARAEACTGCRLCEMLCPDQAIAITVRPAGTAAVGAKDVVAS